MRLGVTGSRFSRPNRLVERLAGFIGRAEFDELHHGDCVGWDEQAFYVAATLGVKTVAHPPVDESLRSFTRSDEILPSRKYLERNRNIVDSVDFLIAAPDGPERNRSGTWSTVRYAKRVGVHGLIWL